MIGRIYHVVDRATNQTVKVGSTIRTLEERWKTYDKEKFSNHYLELVKEIQNNDFDYYDPNDANCPFLWHLLASEHLEMIKCGTYQNGPLSNKLSPLVQKYIGFDAVEASKLGGRIGGLLSRDTKIGIHSPNFNRSSTGRKSGLKNVKSGHLKSISSLGGKASGPISGKRNAESGWMLKVQKMGLGKGGKIGGPKGMHTRWHVNRNVVSPNCKYCSEVS